MAAANEDDSMGVAVEVSIPDANDDDISDIENDFVYPSQAEINVARTRPLAWLLEAHAAQLAGTSRSAATTADDAVAPGFVAPINEIPPLRQPSVVKFVGGDVARTRYLWLIETLDTQFYGPPRRVNTNAD